MGEEKDGRRVLDDVNPRRLDARFMLGFRLIPLPSAGVERVENVVDIFLVLLLLLLEKAEKIRTP